MKPLTDEQRAKIRLQNAARRSRRWAALRAKAKDKGYFTENGEPSIDTFLTMVINGAVELPPCPEEHKK